MDASSLRSFRHAGLGGLAFAFAFGAAPAAHGIDADAADSTAAQTQEDAAETAAEGNDAAALDAVVVTARRRPERAQDVPIALSVLDGEQIESSGYSNLQDLYRQVPNLRVVNTNPRNVNMTIRGLGANLASESLVNSVGVFVDGVYYARPGAAAFDMIDINRVEVLRGPQGTLFGKNTTAGALNITTRQPMFAPEGAWLASVGDYGYYKLAGTLSDGFTDTIAGRITAAVTSRDGTIDNVRTGEELNNLDDKSVRGQLLFNPSEAVSLLLSADHSREKLDCCVDVIDKVVDTFDDGTSIPVGFYARADLLGYTPLPVDAFARRTDIDSPQYYETEQSGVSAKLDWELAGGHLLTAISAWRNWSFDPYNDLDMIGVPILTQGAFFSDSDTFTQELRLASPTGGAVDYLVGLYYLRDTLESRTEQTFGAGAGGWILPGLPLPLTTAALDGFSGLGSSEVRTRSLSAFGHATWHVSDRVDLALGLRYTEEEKSGYSEQHASGGIPLSDFDPALQPVIAAIRAASAPAFDTRQIEGFPDSMDEGDLSGSLSATYGFNEQVNGYASYARGYKSGGINFGANVPASNTIIEPETADSFELGLKSLLLDNRLSINTALFWTKVRDYQTTRIFVSAAGATTIYIANVPEIRSRGVELDANWAVRTGFNLIGSLAYTDAEYVDNPVDQCPMVNPTALCDLSGESLANVSKWAAYLRGAWETDNTFSLAGAAIRPYVNVDLSYRSRFRSGASEETYVPSHALVDLAVGARFEDSGLDVSFWARNLFDRDYYLYRTPLIFNTGAIQARLGNPRMVGVTVRQSF